MLGADILKSGENDVVLNWIGGLHHARKSCGFGFCHVNDCVISILRLLTHFNRVLYIDMDVHHGDGVEEAFLGCSQVMTLSFHQYDGGVFFPGTGKLETKNSPFWNYNNINVPLREGITDFKYNYVFSKVTDNVIEKFRPNVIVLQCGADSLVGDKLGKFHLSIEGHGCAFKKILGHCLPTLCLGGGGYVVENVSRCWT